MKLVLHPGHSKCGSTTIQNAIIKNRRLLEDRGYVMPDPQMRTVGDDGYSPRGETPRPFFRDVIRNEELSLLRDRCELIKEKYSSEDVSVLISAENLVNRPGRSPNIDIHRVLASYFDSTKILYYVRRQDQLLMSAWQQWGYKEGVSLQQFVRRALRRRTPNYRAVALSFEQVYGKTDLQVVPLGNEHLANGDLVTDFFSRLGIERGIQQPARTSANKSLNPYICESLSNVSHIFRDVHDERVKWKLEKLAGDHPGLFLNVDSYFPYQLRQHVHDRFKEDNEFLAKEFIGSSLWPSDIGAEANGAGCESRLEAAQQAAQVMAVAFGSGLN